MEQQLTMMLLQVQECVEHGYVTSMNQGTCDLRACGRTSSIAQKNCGNTVNVFIPCTGYGRTVTIEDCRQRMSFFCGYKGRDCVPSGYQDTVIDLKGLHFFRLTIYPLDVSAFKLIHKRREN